LDCAGTCYEGGSEAFNEVIGAIGNCLDGVEFDLIFLEDPYADLTSFSEFF